MNDVLLKPKLRFKEFSDSWRNSTFMDLGTYFTGGSLSYDSLDYNGEKYCILYGDLYTKYDCYIENIQSKTNSHGLTVYRNDILFPESTTVDAFSLISPACLNEETAETSGVFVIRPYKHINGNFVSYYVKGKQKQRNKLASKAQGTTIIHLYPQLIQTECIFIPSYDEQVKIANLFLRLDKLIKLQQQQVDILSNTKKSLLNLMFAINENNIPSIRFKGFTSSWEQRKLGEISDIVGGGTPNTTISSYWNGNINWFTPAELGVDIFVSSSERKITNEGLNNSSAKILPIGTVLFTSRAGIGTTAILSAESCTNQGFQSIIPHKGVLDSYFVFSMSNKLKSYGETMGAGSTFVEVSGKQMQKMTILLPSYCEQLRIGDLFKSIDSLITLHQHECFVVFRLSQLKISLLNQHLCFLILG